MKLCEKCHDDYAIHRERFCKACKKAVIEELKNAGYLTPAPSHFAGRWRGSEAKENTRETKFGTGH